MRTYNNREEWHNLLLPVLLVLILFIAGACCFDLYYDLNDDVLIKDIMSGAYSGTPSGYTNQILFPLSWLISCLYGVFPSVPVYGLFLCGCMGLSLYLVAYRSLSFYEDWKTKAVLLLVEGLVVFGMFWYELIFVQYSVVCGLMAGAACFWFMTTPHGLSVGEFFLKNLPALLLVVLAFLLRSEMLLLMLPLIGAAGICHWGREVEKKDQEPVLWRHSGWKRIFTRENNLRYFGFALLAGVLLGLCLLGDSLAYRTTDWKNFRDFFDARTRLYDYTWYPSYEKGEEYYQEIGVSEEQVQLIDNYNFGLDEDIDAAMLTRIAAYGEKQSGMGISGMLWELGHRCISTEDAPYNYFVLAAYALVLLLAFVQKEKSYLWKLAFLVVMRSISWLYLIHAGRVVDRIGHPLYIVEFVILMGILVKELHDRPLWNIEKYFRYGAELLFLVMAVISLPFMVNRIGQEQTRRAQVNAVEQLFDAYAKSQPENYYYLDVYSTVDYSEKIFAHVDNSRKNYDLLGGWICKSPLQRQALCSYLAEESTSTADALLQENVFFVAEEGADTEFLTTFYAGREIEIEIELQDRIDAGQGTSLEVYRVVPAQATDSK
jgi:hypothetical protein